MDTFNLRKFLKENKLKEVKESVDFEKEFSDKKVYSQKYKGDEYGDSDGNLKMERIAVLDVVGDPNDYTKPNVLAFYINKQPNKKANLQIGIGLNDKLGGIRGKSSRVDKTGFKEWVEEKFDVDLSNNIYTKISTKSGLDVKGMVESGVRGVKLRDWKTTTSKPMKEDITDSSNQLTPFPDSGDEWNEDAPAYIVKLATAAEEVYEEGHSIEEIQEFILQHLGGAYGDY